MPMFSKESLEALKEKIDLVEVLSPYLDLKRSGATFKAICPFHNEKSPSFLVRRGDSHYHCFGCGAHGDAIAFLMNFLKLSFADAVEHLAEKFQIPLDYRDNEPSQPKKNLKEQRLLLQKARDFFHFHLLHTDEGHIALDYLYKRGLDLPFLQTFGIGFSPKSERLSLDFFKQMKGSIEQLIDVGLVRKLSSGRLVPFFTERVMFPITDMMGNVIGFSARKLKKETFGGKYINTQETELFKKSKVLFGLYESRRRIVKERKAMIVEGQIDCLRLIYEGLNYVVCPGGTAFAEGHLREIMRLGVQHVYLAFDGDQAGQEAAVKAGQLLQKEGVEVSVVVFPQTIDPDNVLQKGGMSAFMNYVEKAASFIPFVVDFYGKQFDASTPAGKNQVARIATKLIGEWQAPLMVHEGMKLLAKSLHVPEEMLEGDRPIQEATQKRASSVDPDKILETDLLRWLILGGQNQREIVELARLNLTVEVFRNPLCAKLYKHILEIVEEDQAIELLHLASVLESDESSFLEELLSKKINMEKAILGMKEALQKVLDREWMAKRAEVQIKLKKEGLSEEELFALAKKFDQLKKKRPTVSSKYQTEKTQGEMSETSIL